MERKKLNDTEIRDRLATLPGWSRSDKGLFREIVFDDFVQAFGFMTQVALLSETMCHHPDWANVYNKVSITLSTHDLDAISTWDFALAERINALIVDQP